MAAVAHSPSFAKKVGVPQKVGKDFTAADKGRKFNSGGNDMNPRARFGGGNIKKMAEGGETTYDGMSFSAAWRAARKDKGAGEVFTYKGKDYSTNTEEEGVGMRRQIPREGKDTSETGPSRGSLGKQLSKTRAAKAEEETPFLSRGKDQAAGAALSRNPKLSVPKDEPLEESHPEDLIGVGKAVAGLGTAAALTRKYGPKILSSMTKIGSDVERRAAQKASGEALSNINKRRKAVSVDAFKKQATENNLRKLKAYEDANAEAYRGMRTGGKVKAYAKGGSVRGGGCESRGKTKGRMR